LGEKEREMKEMSEQIGMTAYAMECNGTSFVVRFINKYPIVLNRTVIREPVTFFV